MVTKKRASAQASAPRDITLRDLFLPVGMILLVSVAAVYLEGWHMLLRDLQAEVVIDDVAHWIENPDTPLPSGADGVLVAQ
jgi:hypothetical protein